MQSQYKVINFSMICLKWLENKRNEVTSNTYTMYEKMLTKYAVPFFDGDKFELNADILRRYISFLHEKGVVDSKIYQNILLLRTMLSQENKMWVTPFIEIQDELPKQAEQKKETGLTKTELKRFETYLMCNMDSMNLGVLLSHKLGLAGGMICALRWSDIDLDKRKVTISRIIIRDTNLNRQRPSDPKTILTERDYCFKGKLKTVTIPKKITEIMTDFIPDDHTKFVLTNTHNITNPRSYQYYVKRCYKECGIEK